MVYCFQIKLAKQAKFAKRAKFETLNLESEIIMDAYCVKCKTKREMQNAQALFSAKGAAYSQGVCGVCGTKLTRWGATETHATVDREAAIARAKQTKDERPKTKEKTKDQRPLRFG